MAPGTPETFFLLFSLKIQCLGLRNFRLPYNMKRLLYGTSDYPSLGNFGNTDVNCHKAAWAASRIFDLRRF